MGASAKVGGRYACCGSGFGYAPISGSSTYEPVSPEGWAVALADSAFPVDFVESGGWLVYVASVKVVDAEVRMGRRSSDSWLSWVST